MRSAIAGLTRESLPVRTGVGITIAASTVALGAALNSGFQRPERRGTSAAAPSHVPGAHTS